MSENNGYATEDQIFEAFGKRILKDETIMGKKVQIGSLTAAEIQQWLDENERSPETINERLVVACSVKPRFSLESIDKLSKLHGGFVMRLAKACSKHVGIESIEETEKN